MIGRVALLVTFKKAKPKPQSLSRSHIRDLCGIEIMREISKSELKLVNYLLEKAGKPTQIPKMVRPLKDGGMGSISFDLKESRKRDSQIIGGSFKDSDGVLVDFELTADENNELFELDLWKVDFSRLLKYPQLNEITITPHNNG